VLLGMCVCQTNLDDVPEMVDLAARLGAWGVRFWHLDQAPGHEVLAEGGYAWRYSREAVFADPRHHDELLLKAGNRARIIGMTADFQEGMFLDARTGEPTGRAGTSCGASSPCPAPWTEMTIGVNGDVRCCRFQDPGRSVIGNILETDFRWLWNSEEMIRQRAEALGKGAPRRCRVPAAGASVPA